MMGLLAGCSGLELPPPPTQPVCTIPMPDGHGVKIPCEKR